MLSYVFITFLVIISIQLFFFLILYSPFSWFYKSSANSEFKDPVSILICAKNEEENLKNHLPGFINQEYFNFEIILINDGSSDGTLAVMEKFKSQHPDKIKIVNVIPNEQFWGNKKYALTLGIKAAKHDYLVFSDADCKPKTTKWIARMTEKFDKNRIVIGYGAYSKKKNSFLNKMVRFETLITAMHYFSLAKIGLPYMGVGRNLAYEKSLFFEINGFIDHMHVHSGDDDLFINAVANKKNTGICIDKESFTYSEPSKTFKSWLRQKRRHITTAIHYKTKHKLLLGIFSFSQISMFVLAGILLSYQYEIPLVLGLILFRTLLYLAHMISLGKKFDEKDLILVSPILELFLILIQMFIFIKNLISKPSHW